VSKVPEGVVYRLSEDDLSVLAPLQAGAGTIASTVTVDNATGDVISFSETVHGPHPLRDGVDICGPSVAYLTS
jgi:hypothetical protein